MNKSIKQIATIAASLAFFAALYAIFGLSFKAFYGTSMLSWAPLVMIATVMTLKIITSPVIGPTPGNMAIVVSYLAHYLVIAAVMWAMFGAEATFGHALFIKLLHEALSGICRPWLARLQTYAQNLAHA